MAKPPTIRRRPRPFLRQLVGLVLIPVVIVLAGRRLGWNLVGIGSRWERLYAPEVSAMAQGYHLLTGRAPDESLRRRLRRQLLMERASWFRSRLLGVRSAARIIGRVEGGWPERGPFLAYGFHRAGGFAVLDHLAAAGHAPIFLHAPPSPGTRIERWLGRMASRQLARLGAGELLTTGGSYQRIRQLTEQGRVVLATVDAPPSDGQSTTDIQVPGLRLRFPEGLFRLAAELAVPVAFFYTRLDDDGRHTLVIRTMDRPASLQAVSRAAGEMLTESLDQDPAGWLYLNGLEAFLTRASRDEGSLSQPA
jgi:hypothetical protein